MKKEIFVIGCGPGDLNFLTQKAINLIKACDEVYAFDRIGDLLKPMREDLIKCTYREIEYQLNYSKVQKIGVLVSGDVGYFSLAKTLKEKFQEKFVINFVPGINILQYFCTKIGLAYENIKSISLHGRSMNILGSIAYNRYVFVLTGGENDAVKVLEELHAQKLSQIKVTVGERLSMTNERIKSGKIAQLVSEKFADLTVLLFENENFLDCNKPLFDHDLTRNDTPLTKQEVRWTAVNMLEIDAGDIIFDIGAGSGSVAIEMARKAHEGIVYAIEKRLKAYDLLNKNKTDLNAFNVITVLGEAVNKIKSLPIPNKVFIGGSGPNLRLILLNLFGINEAVKIVITAITLETISNIMAVILELNLNSQVVCLNVAKNKEISDYNLMIASNPVYVFKLYK